MEMRVVSSLAVLVCAAVMGSAPARAQSGERVLPRWEVGAFVVGVSQQAYPGSETQISRFAALPFIIYRGEVIRADQGSAGLRAIKTDRYEVDVSFSGAFGSRGDEVAARKGMPQLGSLVEFGPRVKFNLTGPGEMWMGGRWRLELPVRGVFDISDGFASRGVSVEPELQFQRRTAGGLNYSLSLGAIFGNRRLTDTFYGVAPIYATAARPAYAADSGLIGWRLGTGFTKSLAPDWRMFGFVRMDSVSGAANQSSPLVTKTNGLTAGLGIGWTWLRSSQAGVE